MNKKNIIALVLIIFFLINIIAIIAPIFVRAEKDVTIKYNNKLLTADVSPVIYNDRVLVPVRMIFEAIDSKVNWEEKTRRVTIITENDDVFKFTINSDVAYINKDKFILDTAAKLISSRTFIPLRFLAENSGLKVSWSDKERCVYLEDVKEEAKDEESGENKEYNYITDIECDESSLTVVFKSDAIVYKKTILEEPVRLVIDLYDCIKDVEKNLERDSKYYKKIRYSQFDTEPMISRVVVELSDDVLYNIDTKDNELKVDFYFEGEEPEDDKEIVYEEEKLNKKYKTVVIDAGHGGKDPGALGIEGKKIILKEKDVDLDIALRVYNRLKKEKVNVYMTRSEDKFLELSEIVEFANTKNADLFVSIHNNASDNEDLSGTMVMYAYDEPKEGFDISGKEVAKTIQKHLVKATDAHDFGARKNSALYVVRKTNMPAVITESLFITNKEDREKLMDEKYIDDIAEAIYKGICEVLEL